MTVSDTLLPGALHYAHRYEEIPGWFYPVDFQLFNAILNHQFAAKQMGELLEIGCYQGKSAILLGYGLRTEETLLVCDLFEDAVNHSHIPDKAQVDALATDFYLNWDRYHHGFRPIVYACESTELAHRTLPQFRFTHIDGCHDYRCVRSDIELAQRHATPTGVIAVDDYRSVHVPGVAAAVWEAWSDGMIYPFAVTDMKLYATVSKPDQEYWEDVIREMVESPPWVSDVYAFPGFNVVRVIA